ncbi:MAG: hypothetical protein OWT28_11605 [Firmicutes bacterium]|nr:hypothetical protein [Bacillota bacterium]
MTTLTVDEARQILRAALTDQVMKQEREQTLLVVEHRARDLLDGMGLGYVLDAPEVAQRFALYKQMHHIPGDHLWQAMQFVFRVARDGGDDADARLVQHYMGIIYRTLFTAPLRRRPQIPDAWWETPLGLACLFVEQGVEACERLLLPLQEALGEDLSDGD